MNHEYILLLGSNMGDPVLSVEKAIAAVHEIIGEVTTCSEMFSSKAWGFESPDLFVNQAISVTTPMSPLQVLQAIHGIENSLGRIRVPASGYVSRTIDIDILHWSGGNFNAEELTIPHPRILERRFALMPLCQISRELIHPDSGKSYQELLLTCSDKGSVHPLMTAK